MIMVIGGADTPYYIKQACTRDFFWGDGEVWLKKRPILVIILLKTILIDINYR